MNPLVERLGWVLVHSLWQFALVALLAGMISRAMRRCSSSARYGVHVAAMGVMVVVSLVTWLFLRDDLESRRALTSGPDAAHSTSLGDDAVRLASTTVFEDPAKDDATSARQTGSVSPPMTKPSPDSETSGAMTRLGRREELALSSRFKTALRPWLTWIVVVWCIGVAVCSLRPLLGWHTLWRLKRVGVSPASEEIAAVLRRVSERLQLRRAVSVLQSTLAQVPVVVGYLRPVVLLPVSLMTRLPAEQLEAILAHELAHVRRHDFVVNLLQTLVETFFFYHPAVWWLSHQIRVEREHCCDDLVVASFGNRVEYGRALLAIEELRGRSTVLALGGADGSLLSRIRRIAGVAADDIAVRWGDRLSSALLGITVIGVTCVLTWNWSVAAKDDAENNTEEAGNKTVTLLNGIDADLTPAKIAEQVEAMMRRMVGVEYAATILETKDANAGFDDKEPLPVSGKGSVRFLSDGERWLADEHDFTFRSGEPVTFPQHRYSGFDGDQHFEFSERALVLGQHDMANARLGPRDMFWHGGLTAGWLLDALKSFNARVVRREMIDGCECLVIVSEPGKPKTGVTNDGASSRPKWHFEITLSPQQSWLPLKTEIQLDGKRYASERLENLTQTPEGVWYPQTIRFQAFVEASTMAKQTRITTFRLRDKFDASEFRRATPLPVGVDIVDYRRSQVWHNDPWWPDLAPWLAEQFAWPRPNLSGLSSLRIHADKKIHGQLAPPIEAAEWLNGNPGPWDRAGRKLSILFFFAGDAVYPTPQWLAGLKGLHDQYAAAGLDVVCVTPSIIDPAIIRRTVKSIDVRFPVAIDSKHSDSKSWGRTHAAFGMTAYDLVLVDASGRMIAVDPADRPAEVKVSLLEHLIRQQLAQTGRADDEPRLSIDDERKVEAEWKRLRKLHRPNNPAEWRLQTLLRFPGDKPPEDGQTAKLEIVPEFRLLQSSTPGGWTLMRDAPLQIVSDEGCDLFGLPKGTYRVTVTRPGFASIDRHVVLPIADPFKPLEIAMLPGDTIRGRIIDTAGQAIEGATVRATKRHHDPTAPTLHTTEHLPRDPRTADNSGQFTFDQLFEGSYTLEVTADGYQPQTSDPIPVGTQDVKIMLLKLGG